MNDCISLFIQALVCCSPVVSCVHCIFLKWLKGEQEVGCMACLFMVHLATLLIPSAIWKQATSSSFWIPKHNCGIWMVVGTVHMFCWTFSTKACVRDLTQWTPKIIWEVELLLVANTVHYTLHNKLDAAKLWCLEHVLWPGNEISEMEGNFFLNM